MDRFGNRWVEAGYKPNLNLTPQSAAEFNAANNRMTAPNAYDAVGNLTSNKVSQTATYDAENRMITFNGGLGVANYRYDGDGRRISQQTAAGATTYYVYNVSGQLAAEYSMQPPATSGTSYLTTDHLGSTRIVTDATGNPKTRHDYIPYGEEIDPQHGGRAGMPGYTATLVDGPTQKFTAKERDSESGLDYFLARYYSGAQGRFTSPDPEHAGASPYDPQSWNAYAYARNNPLTLVDPTGEAYKYCPAGQDQCYEVADEDFIQFQNDNANTLIFEGSNIYTVNADGTTGELYGTYDLALSPSAQEFGSQWIGGQMPPCRR
jgi:RHS repeat-associated protein